MLIFIKPTVLSFKSLINIYSQLNIYMKEIASPPPQRTCLKLVLLVVVGAWGLQGGGCNLSLGLSLRSSLCSRWLQPAPAWYLHPSPREWLLLTG